MITPDYIERSNRRTLLLTVLKNGAVVVKAPISMKEETINRFVAEKQEWIKSKLFMHQKTVSKFEDVIKYKKFLLYGNKYTIVLDSVKRIETNEKFQIIMPSKIEPEKILKTLKAWYKKVAKQVLSERLAFVENKIKLKSNSFRIGDSKGRWGSCNSRGAICLNFRVLMLPPALIDYVIVHELCHLVEMNHSKNFWKLVTSFLPNVDKLKSAIKEYGFLLGLYNE